MSRHPSIYQSGLNTTFLYQSGLNTTFLHSTLKTRDSCDVSWPTFHYVQNQGYMLHDHILTYVSPIQSGFNEHWEQSLLVAKLIRVQRGVGYNRTCTPQITTIHSFLYFLVNEKAKKFNRKFSCILYSLLHSFFVSAHLSSLRIFSFLSFSGWFFLHVIFTAQ